jgi:hypothetical protein
MRTQWSRFLLFALALVGAARLFAQTYEVRLTEVVAGGWDSVQVEIRSTSGSFVLGTSTLIFNYNTAALFAPTKLAAKDGPWDSGPDPDYQDVARVRDSVAGFAGLTVQFVGTSLGGGDDDNGPTVPGTFTPIGMLRFAIKNPSLSPMFSWRAIGITTQVFKLTSPGTPEGGQTDITSPNGTFLDPDNIPLPVQLADFTVSVVKQNQVRLDWTTLTETNNYGFEVQKSADGKSFQTIPNSFIPGHGTTLQPHSYSYTDATAGSVQNFYRLKQIDLDGAVHFSEGQQVNALTSVTERPIPKEFALDQNYPNPFNPTTMIEFALPKETRVTLEVFNILGQRVSTLVDESRPAGYYNIPFDAKGLASGLYFYRMSTSEVSFLKKMVVMK